MYCQGMLTLSLLAALLILAQPLALIASFEIAHAMYCSLFGGVAYRRYH